jgi:ribose/xylose/arabinose/galactoside ABC-type transport system permease subunit
MYGIKSTPQNLKQTEVKSAVKKFIVLLSPIRRLFQSQSTGLVLVILGLGAVLWLFSGSHTELTTGMRVNNFLNPNTLLQMATDATPFAIMAVGATMVIISGGIDLSVGSIYALSGVTMAMMLRPMESSPAGITVITGIVICLGIGLLCGLINGSLVVGLGVHPFIITLGSMWVLRGIAFVSSKAESILVPDSLIRTIKSPLGLGVSLSPIPMIVMLVVAAIGAIYLTRTVAGRHIFAVGGNMDASRYAGLRLKRILIGVYTLSGLTAGIAAFLGGGFYGASCCIDANGYELFVIASAVVGGASLMGGKGNAINAMLGAILITLIKQSIITLQIDENYQWIIIGCAIIIAVVLDQTGSRLTVRRLVQVAAEEPADARRTESKTGK